MNNEKLAVIMTAYNEKENEIIDSINSILNQTYANFCFYILLDNPDNKHLQEIINDYAQKDSRISFFVNEKNLGLVNSLNILIQKVKEDIIVRMDADDVCIEDRIEKELIFMKKYNLDIVMSSMDFLCGNHYIPGADYPDLFPEQIEKIQKHGNVSLHSTWMLKKSVYDSLMGYRNVKYCEDLDFVLRALQFGFKIGRMGEVLVHYRMREDGVSSTYSFEQYKKAKTLRNAFSKGNSLESLNVQSLNNQFDHATKKEKADFEKAKKQIDRLAKDFYKKKFHLCTWNFLKNSLTTPQYFSLFFDTFFNKLKIDRIIS